MATGEDRLLQDIADDLQRMAQREKARRELLKVLFNRRAYARILQISEQDWREAQARDDNPKG